jgi:hypothetical protein
MKVIKIQVKLVSKSKVQVMATMIKLSRINEKITLIIFKKMTLWKYLKLIIQIQINNNRL